MTLLLRPAPLRPTGATGPSDSSSSPDPVSEFDDSVAGVVVAVPAVAVAVPSPSASAFSLRSRASLQSIPVYSHHLWRTRVPPRRSVPSQRARIGRVTTNFATVFCLRRKNVLTLTIPASLIAPARRRYFHFLSLPLRGILPVSLLSTLPWKASRSASIFPVSTQDSAPKRRTCCVTAM